MAHPPMLPLPLLLPLLPLPLPLLLPLLSSHLVCRCQLCSRYCEDVCRLREPKDAHHAIALEALHQPQVALGCLTQIIKLTVGLID
jgi:hypothetical protein